MEELTIKELATYLPYGVKVEIVSNEINYIENKLGAMVGLYPRDRLGLRWHIFTSGGYELDKKMVKPILRPLSDLTKEIEHNDKKFIPLHKILESYCFDISKMSKKEILSYAESLIEIDMSYQTANLLFEWHFDVFGLIYKGLAIDINTLTSGEFIEQRNSIDYAIKMHDLFKDFLKEHEIYHLINTRNKEISTIKCIFISIIREKTTCSLKEIGKLFNLIDHSTVIHNIKKAANLKETKDNEYLCWSKEIELFIHESRN